jgi:hypothetical protein
MGRVSFSRGIDRRGFLSVGTVGGLGLSLGDFLRLQAARGEANPGTPPRQATASSVISIYLPGGVAHQETFDPKPLAPAEYRGPFGSIDTALPGVRFGELLPHTAKIADKLAICRSMTHGEAAHERGTHNMFTGYRPSPALQYPSFGSVISHEFGPRDNLPPYVCIPNQPNEFAGSGYLSSAYSGFSLGADPADGRFKVRDLNLPEAKTNPNGSGISLGHPIGATGCILTVKAIHELQRTGGRYALVTMCIGGGQGIAAIFERL